MKQLFIWRLCFIVIATVGLIYIYTAVLFPPHAKIHRVFI